MQQKQSINRKLFKDVINSILIVPLLFVLATVLVVNHEMVNPTISAKYSWFCITLSIMIISALLTFILNSRIVKISVIDVLNTVFCFWGIIYTYVLNNRFSFELILLLLIWNFYIVCRIISMQKEWYSRVILFVFRVP